jgi:hypothetical protein
MSNKHKRKRGSRKMALPSRLRQLDKQAKSARKQEAAQEEDTSDEEVLSSTESVYGEDGHRELETWRGLEAEFNARQTLNDEDEREVTWSPSPEPDQAQFPVEENDQDGSVVEDDDDVDSPVQPFGDYCIVICRLSSQKEEPATASLTTVPQRQEAHRARRREEGVELGRRLAANCPAPVTFREIFATCHKRRSAEYSDWNSTVRRPSIVVTEIRDWFSRPQMLGSKVTVLIRAVDGLTTHPRGMKTFLQLLRSLGVVAQIIFQYNKVYQSIRPLHLRNFRGLGGTVDIMAADFLAHLEGTKLDPAVARIVEIWSQVEDDKSGSLGIQDRNGLLPADADGPIQGDSARQVGRN